jgi:hypothetical protein
MVLAYFRTHIVRSSYHRHSCSVCILEHLGYSEVTQLDGIVPCQKDVLSLNVSMQNFPSMHVLQREAQLYEPIENLRLRKIFILLQFPLDVEG